jgi:hypothetical protein
VKQHVVDEKIRRAVHGSEDLGDLFGQRGMVLLLAAFGGQSGQIALQDQPRFNICQD